MDNHSVSKATVKCSRSDMRGCNVCSKINTLFPHLYISPNNKRKPSLDKDANNPSKSTPNPNTWHPKLKSALQKPLQVAGYPSFSAVMKYCQKSPDSVYTKDDEICTPNAFFGRCYLGNKCKRSHSLPSDEKVEQILKMTEKFISSPQGLSRG